MTNEYEFDIPDDTLEGGTLAAMTPVGGTLHTYVVDDFLAHAVDALGVVGRVAPAAAAVVGVAAAGRRAFVVVGGHVSGHSDSMSWIHGSVSRANLYFVSAQPQPS